MADYNSRPLGPPPLPGTMCPPPPFDLTPRVERPTFLERVDANLEVINRNVIAAVQHERDREVEERYLRAIPPLSKFNDLFNKWCK